MAEPAGALQANIEHCGLPDPATMSRKPQRHVISQIHSDKGLAYAGGSVQNRRITRVQQSLNGCVDLAIDGHVCIKF